MPRSLFIPASELCADQDRRWAAGERPKAEDYLAQYPELAADTQKLLDLIYNEVVLREAHGEHPTCEEYTVRFPKLTAELRAQFEVHGAIEAGGKAYPGGTLSDGRSAVPIQAGTSKVLGLEVVLPGSAQGHTLGQTPEQAATAAMLSGANAIPGYETIGVLGRGGMGVVYKARQTGLNRVVAVKMILSGSHADPDERERFQREAEIIAQLQHPNIVQIHAVGDHHGSPFLALEFVEGGSLAALLQGTPRSAAWAARLVETLARAVHMAHEQGIVHRDLKPANVLMAPDGTPKLTDFGLAKRVDGPDRTTTGVFGSPSYMAPEQARGQTQATAPVTDVYGLGAVLYEILTGRPPFRGETPIETLNQVLTDDPVPPRQLQPRLPRDIETICLKCLAKEPARRYPSALELAEDLRRFQASEPIRARPVGTVERATKWVKRHPARTAAMLAALVLSVAVLIVVNAVNRHRAAERRAGDLVFAFASADTSAVPRLLGSLKEHPDLIRARLRDVAIQPIHTKPGLHARMALLATDPEFAEELAAYVPICRPEEVVPIRELLEPHAPAVAPLLWQVLVNEKAPAERRVRAAAALAGLAPRDDRWAGLGPTVTGLVVRENPLRAEPWLHALEPVRAHLIPNLLSRYSESRQRLRSGKLNVAGQVAEVAAFDLATRMLAQYTVDRPADLFWAALNVEAPHYPLFAPAMQSGKAALIPLLKSEVAHTWIQDIATVAQLASVLDRPVAAVAAFYPSRTVFIPDGQLDPLAKRQGYAAATLLSLGEAESVWPLLKNSPDPNVRSYLVERLAAIHVDPLALIDRFGVEEAASPPNVSVLRALLITLGDFPPELVPEDGREAFVAKLLGLYENHPDPGLHSAIDWLLRQKWEKAESIKKIDAKLRTAAEAIAFAAIVNASVQGEPRPPVPIPGDGPTRGGRNWYVNAQGQTYAVIRGPTKFRMGFGLGDSSQSSSMPARWVTIDHDFAVSTKELSMDEYLRFNKEHTWNTDYTTDRNGPAVTITMYAAAKYCNWLSEQEGIPRNQWCYEPNAQGKYAEGMRIKPDRLKLTGYRLPTGQEWECAARADTLTFRYFGRCEELLGRYGWSLDSARMRGQPIGQLRPNDYGLFDVYGNVQEWIEDLSPNSRPSAGNLDDGNPLAITNRQIRFLRGASTFHESEGLRSTFNDEEAPDKRYANIGFRPMRTLPK